MVSAWAVSVSRLQKIAEPAVTSIATACANVFRLQHLSVVLAGMRTKISIGGAGADHGHADVVPAQLFR